MTVNVYTYEDGSKYGVMLSSVREPNASGSHTGSSYEFFSHGIFGRTSLEIKNEDVKIELTHTSADKLLYAALAEPKSRRFIIECLTFSAEKRQVLKDIIARKEERYESIYGQPTMETAQ